MIAVSSMPVFKNMVKSKCWSWSQKKALASLIETDIATKIEEYIRVVWELSQNQDFVDDLYDAVNDPELQELAQKAERQPSSGLPH